MSEAIKDWEIGTIGSLIARDGGSIKTGPFGTVLKAAEYSRDGVPLISVGEIGYGFIQVHTSTPRAPAEVVARLPEYVLRSGDIVFARKGAIDRSAIVTREQDGWFLGSDGIRLRLPSSCEPRFIAYHFQNPRTRSWLEQHSTGSTMPSLNQGTIERVPVELPSRSEQKAIAAILGALDDKIELNRRTNATLEALARALFKSWFVDFDPVKAKIEGRHPFGVDAATAALFPSQFVQSELGDIPEGWTTGTLGVIADNPRTVVQPHELSSDTPYIGLEHMPRRCLALTEWGQADDVSSHKSAFVRGDFLFGKLRPYFHKVGIAAVDGISSTDIAIVRAKKREFYALTLSIIFSDEFVEYTNQLSNGAKMPRINWSDMAKFEVVLPSLPIVSAYNTAVVPMLEQIQAMIHENKKLSDLRDYLLPKLISGEIRIRDAEKFVGAA